MRLQYIFANSKSKPHPFHVKSNWQPPPQPSVALESYLEGTKYEIASITFSPVRDNLSAKQRQAVKTLRTNSEVSLQKPTRGLLLSIMDTIETENSRGPTTSLQRESYSTYCIRDSH